MSKIREKFLLAYIAEDYDGKAAINEEDGSINFIISDDKIDRHGEIVEQQAIADAIAGFAANPVCLACHRHSLDNGMPSIVGSWDTASYKLLAHRSEMRLRFARDTVLGMEWWKLYLKRHARAVSIGFRILDMREEAKDGKRIFIITKLELFEISVVPVGANGQALAKGLLSDEEQRCLVSLTDRVAGEVLEKAADETLTKTISALADRLAGLEEGIDELKILVADSERFAQALLPGSAGDSAASAGDKQNSGPSTLETLASIIDNYARSIKHE